MRSQTFIVFAAALARLGLAAALPELKPGNNIGHAWYPEPTYFSDTQDETVSDPTKPRGRSWYPMLILRSPMHAARDDNDGDPETTPQIEYSHEESGHSWYNGWPVGPNHTGGGHSCHGWPKATPTAAAEP